MSANPRFKWRFGLQWRLIIGFAAILALSTGAVALFTGIAAHREVGRIQTEQDRVRASRINFALADFYRTNGDWNGAKESVAKLSFQGGAGNCGGGRGWQRGRRQPVVRPCRDAMGEGDGIAIRPCRPPHHFTAGGFRQRSRRGGGGAGARNGRERFR